ncbi:hypothetical protein SDC9_212168 [bioreactor metagenome]|uniref:Uncharacterized protein n=1 Tax=bioreactor metagenome TaxID=1076179 RepID=A0A645JLV3_9ZZZZ
MQEFLNLRAMVQVPARDEMTDDFLPELLEFAFIGWFVRTVQGGAIETD